MPSLRSAPLARGVLAAAVTVLSLSLAGCGGDGSTASSPAAVREVVDTDGTTMAVPVRPERVVALSEPTLDGVLALGITPVGTITGRGQSSTPAYLGERAASIPVLGAVAQPDYEAIAQAEPDLILLDGTSINNNPEAIAILRRIAPTYDAGLAGADWRTTFARVADAVNRTAEGEQVTADYDEQVAAARLQLTGYGDDTFSVVRWQGGSASLILQELPAGQALVDLGLRRPAAQDRRGRGHSEPVSLENLEQIDGDYLFFGTLGGSSVQNTQAGGSSDVAAAEQALSAAEQVPGFSGLRAVREDHVIPVDGSLWTSTGGPTLMSGIVDSVVQALG